MYNQIIISLLTFVPTALISGIISYLLTSKKCKTDIEKLKISHQNKINEITTNFENEIKRMELLHKQKFESDQNKIINNIAENLVSNMFGNIKSFEDLKKLKNQAEKL